MASGENKLFRRRIANAYLSAVISISLVLLLVGVAALLLVNAESVSAYFKENMRISVLMKPEVTESQAQAYEAELAAMPFVRSTEFISRQRGEEEMTRMLGEDFLSVFETSPIPVSVDLTLNAAYVTDDSLKVVDRTVGASPLVEEVVYQKSLVDALNDNLRKISVVLGVFILLLLFISFVLIGNTVRLTVFDRRFNIHTMKLVGATRAFIRRPFLVRAVFLGLFSSLLSLLMLLGVLYIVRNEFGPLFAVIRPQMLLVVMGIVVCTGVAICLLSTWRTVGKLVSMEKDDLYY